MLSRSNNVSSFKMLLAMGNEISLAISLISSCCSLMIFGTTASRILLKVQVVMGPKIPRTLDWNFKVFVRIEDREIKEFWDLHQLHRCSYQETCHSSSAFLGWCSFSSTFQSSNLQLKVLGSEFTGNYRILTLQYHSVGPRSDQLYGHSV